MALLIEFLNNAIPISYFTVSNRTLVTEASDLTNYNLQQQIYSDAVDVGFAIFSEKTGKRVVVGFYLSHVEQRDGNTLWWSYKPIRESCYKYPDCGDLEIKIFND